MDRRSISVIDEIPPDEPTDTFLETVRFEKARTTIEASEASQVAIAQSELGVSELPLPQSGQYSLRGIDADEFIIDTATGNITSVGAMDYEAPTGGVAANSTEYKFDVVFTASDGTEYIDEVTFNLLADSREVIDIGNVEVTLIEASSVVINTNGNRIFSEKFMGFIEADSTSGTFELIGTDADEFSVDADGVITAIGGLDFENPTGGISGNSNSYEFTYKYTSSTGQIYSEDVTVNVLDFADTNAVASSSEEMTYGKSWYTVGMDLSGTPVAQTIDFNLIAEQTRGLQEALVNYPGGTLSIGGGIIRQRAGANDDPYVLVNPVGSTVLAPGSLTLSGGQVTIPTTVNAGYYGFTIHYDSGSYNYITAISITVEDTAGSNRVVNELNETLSSRMNLDVTLDGVNSLSIDLLDRNLINTFADFEIARPLATLTLISVTPPAGGNAGDITFLPTGELSISSAAVQGGTYSVNIQDIYGWNTPTGIIDININSANENSSSTISSKINTSNLFSSNARRVTTEIIPTYGDSLVSEASTEFNLTETPSFTMELSNFELLKDFSETFEGGTFNLSGLDVSNVSINQQTGELLLSSLDFENPNDSDTDNVYEFVINYEANGNIFIQNVKINILDVALPDMIPATTTVEATEAQSISINAPGTHELSTEFLEYVSQNQGGVFSLRGTDGSLSNLSINSATGEITASNFSFENPLDANTDNAYEFIVEYCVNDERVQENVLLEILNIAGDLASTSNITKNVNYQNLMIHPYFQLNGEITTFYTNVETQITDAGTVPRIAPMLEEFVARNPNGTYALSGLAGSGTLVYGTDFTVDANTGQFIFDENQLSASDMGDYTMRLEYSSPTGNFIQDLTFVNLRTNTSVDGVSDNTIQQNNGTVTLDFLGGADDLTIDLVSNENDFPFIEAFYSTFARFSADGLGNITLSNLQLDGNAFSGGISISNTGQLTLSKDLVPGTYTFTFETEGVIDTMNSITGKPLLTIDFTVNVSSADPTITSKTVSSTSPTTPPVLTKVEQQGLATRLDYQITEARGFKVHAPDEVGDREELKKFIDANPRGTFGLSGADAAKFTVDSDGMIKSQSQIDFEKQNSFEYELTYTAGGASYKESYFLTVVDDPADNGKHLRDIGVGTRASSAEAVEILNVALGQLTSSRAKLGAIENRLTYNISNLTKASMLTDQASGRITDTNFAQETSKLAKNQILNQASMAMLSQANQSKQNVLQLLG